MDRPTKRFLVTYRDTHDPDNGGVWRCFAYDADHAREKFWDEPDVDGWHIVNVDRPRDAHGKVRTDLDREP